MPREIVSITPQTFISSLINTEDYTDGDAWFGNSLHHFADENGAISIADLARKSDNPVEVVLATARRMWDQGLLETVMAYLAVGIADGSTWSCGVTTVTPQSVCDSLAEHNDNGTPDEILLIRNGVDGPVVIGHYNVNKDYEPHEPD